MRSKIINALASRAGRVRRCEDGVSTVEFALVVPVLAFSLLAAVDLGVALSERISMGHVVRSGAQVAMEDPGVADVKAAMTIAANQNFHTTADDPGTINTEYQPLALNADRYCACPDQPDVAVDCSNVCTGTVPTYIYYRVGVEKQFAGVLGKGFPMSASAQVQVR